jgi:hypothetical protein
MRLSGAFSLLASATFSRSPVATAATASKAAFVVSRLGALQIATTGAAAFATGINPSKTSNQRRYMTVDSTYPGTAVERMLAVRTRVKELTEQDLNGNWEDVRRKILWAGGLRDLPDAIPGQGYTGHSFNDFNHVDLTCMAEQVSNNENDGAVKGIAIGNRLGSGIRIASLEELGPGGSWSTCAIGCNKDPPSDVAHVQFQARVAFKLVWVPNENFDAFVLVDDDGNELAVGKPSEGLPSLQERTHNYGIMKGSKYSRVADDLAKTMAAN